MRTEKNNVIQVNLLINLQLNNVVPASDQTVAHLHCISEEFFFFIFQEKREMFGEENHWNASGILILKSWKAGGGNYCRSQQGELCRFQEAGMPTWQQETLSPSTSLANKVWQLSCQTADWEGDKTFPPECVGFVY